MLALLLAHVRSSGSSTSGLGQFTLSSVDKDVPHNVSRIVPAPWRDTIAMAATSGACANSHICVRMRSSTEYTRIAVARDATYAQNTAMHSQRKRLKCHNIKLV